MDVDYIFTGNSNSRCLIGHKVGAGNVAHLLTEFPDGIVDIGNGPDEARVLICDTSLLERIIAQGPRRSSTILMKTIRNSMHSSIVKVNRRISTYYDILAASIPGTLACASAIDPDRPGPAALTGPCAIYDSDCSANKKFYCDAFRNLPAVDRVPLLEELLECGALPPALSMYRELLISDSMFQTRAGAESVYAALAALKGMHIRAIIVCHELLIPNKLGWGVAGTDIATYREVVARNLRAADEIWVIDRQSCAVSERITHKAVPVFMHTALNYPLSPPITSKPAAIPRFTIFGNINARRTFRSGELAQAFPGEIDVFRELWGVERAGVVYESHCIHINSRNKEFSMPWSKIALTLNSPTRLFVEFSGELLARLPSAIMDVTDSISEKLFAMGYAELSKPAVLEATKSCIAYI